MKVTISKLIADEAVMQQVADAYQASYNKLSEGYKSKEEMALYTYDYFYQKVKRFAAENEQSNLSRTFMINLDGKPVGLVRYSRIPEYYKHAQNGQTKDLEKGYHDIEIIYEVKGFKLGLFVSLLSLITFILIRKHL